MKMNVKELKQEMRTVIVNSGASFTTAITAVQCLAYDLRNEEKNFLDSVDAQKVLSLNAAQHQNQGNCCHTPSEDHQ